MADNRCVYADCSRNVVDGKTMCSVCYEARRARIASGVCMCGNPTAIGRDLCHDCYETVLRRKVCDSCHINQANVGKNFCQQCYLRYVSSMTMRMQPMVHEVRIRNNRMCKICGTTHAEDIQTTCYICGLLTRNNIDPNEMRRKIH